MKIQFVDSIEKINRADWQALVSSSCPFIQYDYFFALENSRSACVERGWQPHHLVVTDEHEQLQAIFPMYIKQHSWGEYVFDWAWAEAYERYQLPYYPKLVASIPFTPVPCEKLLINNVTAPLNLEQIFNELSQYCQKHELNSWHSLFIAPNQLANKQAQHIEPATIEVEPSTSLADYYLRHTVQFHWFNRNYQTFDEFLAGFTARKRKNTKKERLSIAKQGLSIEQLTGKQLTQKELDYFYLAYQLTYLKKGHQPHLTYQFFEQIFNHFADNILLVVASHEQRQERVACALFFYDQDTLYGRYWGCSEQFNNLHFELCYYQGIEFCIQNNLTRFNPGTQGEHKIQRGFEPVLTHSYHWVKHAEFKPAIKAFCQQECQQMQIYQKQCQQALPFNAEHVTRR
ncbi:GNAT family N-acetyltransferase [Thalassotalea agariperforans]